MFRNLALPGAVLFALALGAIFNPRFFDPLSLLITFGGAAAVTYFSFSEKQLRGLARAIHQLLKAPESTLVTLWLNCAGSAAFTVWKACAG